MHVLQQLGTESSNSSNGSGNSQMDWALLDNQGDQQATSTTQSWRQKPVS